MEEALLRALLDGDVGRVRKLLSKGAAMGAVTVDGVTALHCACYEGHRDVVSLLLDRGAAMDAVDVEGATALHSACQ